MGTGSSCYHHNINEPTKVVELEPQEQNIWNTKPNLKNDNVFYSKHIRNKASSDSSVDHYGLKNNVDSSSNKVHYGYPSDQNVHNMTSQNTIADGRHVKVSKNVNTK